MIHRLDRARWSVLSPYLDEALDLADAVREAWVSSLRARDPALAVEIEALLAEYRQVEDEDFPGRGPEPRSTLAGQVLGAYTLREQIGHGGMGSVWLADRSDGRYEGVAAVKLLNVSLLGNEAEERFRREGSILARLRHPHIAHLIDAGVSPSGQPYLVLEHVDGKHLDADCDGRRLGVEARVRLFLDVLAAVSHAHANLIVHRDLKPSNVLVDRGAAVKLLDFGVAKLLSPEAEAAVIAVTRDGPTALTPEYAAPEQLAGQAITTATDVFALGVLLYELLSGRLPTGAAARTSPGELLCAILEREPPRLSAAVTVDDGALGSARERAADRGLTPQALSRALRGDLETIVAKALKKEPAERYASVGALANDLRRYLDHAPISARPDAFVYRAGKFVRRHRLPVALAAALLGSLAAGLAGTIWQARAAARERDLALAQLQRAENINEFTEFLMEKALPGGELVRVGDILGRAEKLAEKRSEYDPGLAVDLLVNIGNHYVTRDETDNARRTLKRAYDLSGRLADPAPRASATCNWARAVAMNGDRGGAQRLIDAGLALTSADARFDGVAVSCLLARAEVAMPESPDVVSSAAVEALSRLNRQPAAFPNLRAGVLQTLAMGHRMAGRTADSDRTFAAALEQLRRLGQGDSSDAGVLLSNWAMNTSLTSPLRSLEQNRRVVEIFDGGAPDSVPLPLLQNYALQLSRVGRHAEARAVLERSQVVARRHDQTQGLVLSSVRLAQACRELGDLACARRSLETAAGGVTSASSAGIRGDLAREQGLLAAAQGHDEEAHRLLLDAYAIHAQLKAKNLTQIETLLELSRLELRMGLTADAETRARAALAVAESLLGGTPHSSWVGRSLLALGAARQARGDAAGARELLGRAMQQMATTLGAGHPAVLEARRRIAQ